MSAICVNQLCVNQQWSLANNDIHIWQIKPSEVRDDVLLDGVELLSAYHQLLSADEVTKYQRYKFADDKRNGLITRAFIRCVLSHYAATLPNQWQFKRGEKGRPSIVNSPTPINFNLSHTKDLIVCAVTPVHDVGVDVEFCQRRNDILKIADRFFSPQEVTELFSLPEEQQKARFFDYWTLKEAYIKAWGLGLAIPLKDFSFAINDNNRLLRNSDMSLFDDISISFAAHREDSPEVWRHWLMSPSEVHRLALAVRNTAKKPEPIANASDTTNYAIKRFSYIPGFAARSI